MTPKRRVTGGEWTEADVPVIARIMAITGRGEPMSYWEQEASGLLASLNERAKLSPPKGRKK